MNTITHHEENMPPSPEEDDDDDDDGENASNMGVVVSNSGNVLFLGAGSIIDKIHILNFQYICISTSSNLFESRQVKELIQIS
jgi:hypothetical protein